MQLTDLQPFGARWRDPTVDRLGPVEAAAVAEVLAERGVLVIDGAGADDQAFVRFLSSLGSMTFTRGEAPVPGCPALNLVSNVGRRTPPRSVFHVDTTYLRRPPAYTALRAVTVPDAGGATEFTDQRRAFDAIDPCRRRDLAGRTVRHVASGLDLGPEDEREAEHPLLLVHPRTGRTALYLSTPERCVSVSGLAGAEGDALIADLYEHSIGSGPLLRHEWAVGDVVVWDNRCVMHRADHDGVEGDRVLHRGVVDAV